MDPLGKKKPILVRYLGEDALRHPTHGSGEANYFFAGQSPVTVKDPLDIAFYEHKARANPKTWALGEKPPEVVPVPAPKVDAKKEVKK